MKTLRVTLFGALMLLTAACATWTQHKDVAEIGITYATLKFVEKAGTPLAQFERAERIRMITEDIQEYASGESVTVDVLRDTIIARLPSTLSASDRYLAMALVDAVMEELRARIAGNLITKDQLLEVNDVAKWIIRACGLAAPPENP